MTHILIILSTILMALNLFAPAKVSNVSGIILIVEHLFVIYFSRLIIKKHLVGKASKYIPKYQNCFLLGYSISLLLLYLYWTPYMIKDWTTDWGAFDPVKYYAIASTIVDGEIVPNIVGFPVCWIYVGIFYLLGKDPLIPLYINVLVSLYSSMILSRFINTDNPRHLKTFSLILLVPEIIYFNIMSAKDIICMNCAVIIFIHSLEFIDGKFKKSHILITVLAFFAMVLARTSMSFVAILGVLIMFVVSGRFSLKKIVPLLFFLAIITGALALTIGLGSHESTFDMQDKIMGELEGDMSVVGTLEDQSSNSFMKLLIPHNTFEFIFFGIIRSLCYVLIDPGMITNPQSRFIFDGSFKCLPMPNTTTVLMCCSLPFIIIQLYTWKSKSENFKKLALITTMYMLVVGMFNPMMLHIRYRVVYDLLYFALALKSFLLFKNKRKLR